MFLHADSEDSDQTGCTGHFVGFVMWRLKFLLKLAWYSFRSVRLSLTGGVWLLLKSLSSHIVHTFPLQILQSFQCIQTYISWTGNFSDVLFIQSAYDSLNLLHFKKGQQKEKKLVTEQFRIENSVIISRVVLGNCNDLTLFFFILPYGISVECQALGTTDNGRYEIKSDSLVTMATVTCDEGYSLNGSFEINCQTSGFWDIPVTPSCGMYSWISLIIFHLQTMWTFYWLISNIWWDFIKYCIQPYKCTCLNKHVLKQYYNTIKFGAINGF